jgi:ABC-type lipoprotein release transport system permease subunit
MNFIIFKIAIRNIFLHRMKTMIVGSILVFGSFIAVLGNSIVEAISSGMKNSVTHSVTGDLQVYSAKAKDKLSVFGNMDGSPSDIGFVNDFSKIKSALMKEPNVKAVIPMGNSSALINPGNMIDVQVEKLRNLYKKKPKDNLAIEQTIEHLKFLIRNLQNEVNEDRASSLLVTNESMVNAKAWVKEALADKFWHNINEHFEEKLEFIANKIAPLIIDETILYFGYIGTDPQEFSKYFPQFEIVKGEMIPDGKRGFLIHDYIYENFVKNRIARRLDSIKKEILENKKTIAQTKELQDQIKASKEQLAEIYLTVPYHESPQLIKDLQKELNSNESDLKKLLELFLDLNDQNFLIRFQFFYAKIAPLIQLYKVQIGDLVPLSAFTKLGNSAATNIKVWGTFHFKSFENSPLAGNFSIVDMNSFRELYGFQTESRKKQNKEIEQEMGIQELSREQVESMFGNDEKSHGLDNKKELTISETEVPSNETDVFISAAIILNDTNQSNATLASLEEINKSLNLGLKIVDWQEASGIIGQMTLALKMILYFFVFILFLMASLMIMNSLLMATMERQQEIGTMRAIGASKPFIYRTFLYESFATSVVFTAVGSLLACIFILIVGKKGIPANGDIATFFFSGSRLYFFVQWNSIFFVFLGIIFISFLATQYPAWRAMRISPLLAMQKKD